MRALLAMVLLAAAAGAHAAAPVFQHPISATQLTRLIAPAATTLAQTPVLRGSFVQRKYLKDIPKPLRSSGHFVIQRDRGIYWHTLLPFDSEFILTPTTMAQLDGGRLALRLDASQQPALRLVGDLFFSIFALDAGALAKNFALHGQRAGSGDWQIGLTPNTATLAAVLNAAVIDGDTQVRKVEIWDAHGDRTEIQLSSAASSAPLSAEEAARFAD